MAGERCGRCHRKLKTPESVAVGFGSSCYKMLFGKPLKRETSGLYRSLRQNRNGENEELEGQMSVFDLESEV